jgi:hypothetical protein
MANFKNTHFKSALGFQSRQLSLSLEIIATQRELLNLVRNALPSEIAGHVQHCVHSGQRVIVYTEASAWASQIRFFQQAILNKLTIDTPLKVVSLQIKILQKDFEPLPRRAPRLPSLENILQLQETSTTLAKSDELQLSLARLAKTLEQRKRITKNQDST